MSSSDPPWRLDDQTITAIIEGRHGDPFAVLGPHGVEDGTVVRAFAPGAERLEVRALDGTLLGELARRHEAGFFEGLLTEPSPLSAYRLRARRGPWWWDLEDPYRFEPIGKEAELAQLWDAPARAWERLGARLCVHQGTVGVAFAVWAPRASRVAVVGDFNGWDPRTHVMRRRRHGIWELFVPGVPAGTRYRFAICDEAGRALPLRGDPFALATEAEGAAVVRMPPGPLRQDAQWRASRARDRLRARPVAVLELPLAIWLTPEISGAEAVARSRAIVAIARELGFSHLALRAPDRQVPQREATRATAPAFAPLLSGAALDALPFLVEAAHAASVGVVLDFCLPSVDPAELGLARFDGAPLFEPAHGRGWDVSRSEVARYLAANARFLLKVFDLDGLRFGELAIAEEDAASRFVRALTDALARDFPDRITIAGTVPFARGLTRATALGGLGFTFAENRDFTSALAAFLTRDAADCPSATSALALLRAHAFAEQFVLPLRFSAPTGAAERKAGERAFSSEGLRAALGYAWGHPGKKLLAWDSLDAADPALFTESREHPPLLRLIAALNRLYCDFPALHRLDGDPGGHSWIHFEEDPALAAWLRLGQPGDAPVLVVANLGARHHGALAVGVPCAGLWRLILSTQACEFGGAFEPTASELRAEPEPRHGRPFSLTLDLPPRTVLFLAWDGMG